MTQEGAAEAENLMRESAMHGRKKGTYRIYSNPDRAMLSHQELKETHRRHWSAYHSYLNQQRKHRGTKTGKSVACVLSCGGSLWLT